jgi:hypothetical protein
MADSNRTATIAITPDAREAFKRIQRRLFPNVTRPTYSDAIHELERRLNSGALDNERETVGAV